MDVAMIATAASRHNGLMLNTTHQTIRGYKTLDTPMMNKNGYTQTLREFFATKLVRTGETHTQLIQRTERATDNRVYIIHLKEHRPIIINFIKQLEDTLLETFTEEELSKSKGELIVSNWNRDTYSSPATKKNAAILKTLFGESGVYQHSRPPPRPNQRKPIQTQYPHEYPKLPTSKSNAWDDRRAR